MPSLFCSFCHIQPVLFSYYIKSLNWSPTYHKLDQYICLFCVWWEQKNKKRPIYLSNQSQTLWKNISNWKMLHHWWILSHNPGIYSFLRNLNSLEIKIQLDRASSVYTLKQIKLQTTEGWENITYVLRWLQIEVESLRAGAKGRSSIALCRF